MSNGGKMDIWILVLIALICFAGAGVIGRVEKAPLRKLEKGFANLEPIIGRTFQEIKNEVGLPQSVDVQAGGGRLRQWIIPGFHIALLFDKDDVCLGITHSSRL